MKLSATNLASIILLGLIPAACHAQEFSADVVYLAVNKPDAPSTGTATSPHGSSKLYVSKDKIRLETNGLTGTILLADRAEHTAVALQPQKRAVQLLASGPSQYFRVENADDACQSWQRFAEQKIVCEKIGPEEVNGRETVKYRNKSASDTAPAAVWVDKTLKFVIKWQGAGNGAELHNIKEEQQAADLFAVPNDYKTPNPQKATTKGFSKR
ncbi:MAG: hypothetical protein DMG78_04110 [Acidobacteria bacterium]|nr:MAG: hypothetical protein DMG78_04110 [Acidobacteriota bacterium]